MPKILPFELNAYSLFKTIKIETVVEYFNTKYPDLKYHIENISFEDNRVRAFEKKIRPTPTSYLLGRLNADWNILIDDQVNSDGCSSMLWNLNRQFKCEGINVHYSDGPTAFYSQGTMFTYYSAKGKRVIHAYWDNNKWVFFQQGPIMPIEKPEYYKRKKITDRFNKIILDEYLQAMDLSEIPSMLMSSDKILKLVKYRPEKPTNN